MTESSKRSRIRYVLRGVMIWALAMVALGVALWVVLRTAATATPAAMAANGEAMMGAKRVVAVVAHPDDAEYWMSGTLKRLGDAGARVVLIVASDGEKGPNRVNSADLGATRRAEQKVAGSIMGYDDIVFLGQPDRSAADGEGVPGMIEDVLTRESPDLVITFDGWKPQLPYLHPDHEAIGRMTVRLLRNMDYRGALYLFHTRRPDTAVDISAVVKEKADAFRAHVSQHGGGTGEGPVRRMRATGAEYGLPPVEMFRGANKR
ncbi:MAG: PIG-L family deacetylase [Armatimonadota bacterium]|nr:PIG-L family deacetylase [Armatimonadota bacterium]